MTDPTAPYVKRDPGDLWTVEDFHLVQRAIHADIRATSQKAADGVTHVATAGDAGRLEGKNLDALTAEVTRRVLDEVRGRTGYQQLFKILKGDDVSVLQHELGTYPLVDVYKLEYFEVVCREDDETRAAFATFYLHHSSERRIRVTNPDGTRRSIDIQPKELPELGIPFADMLTRYGVAYSETTSVEDLENEFWQAFFRDPNDQFGDDQYCHSPWFERCCRQRMTVKQAKESGDWDDMVFQVRPWKTVNFAGTGEGDQVKHPPAPANVGVLHLDLNRTAVWLVGPAVHGGDHERELREYVGPEFDNEHKLMVLLKV